MTGRFTKHLENAEVGVDCTKCKADWAKAHRGKDMGSCTALYCRNRLKNRLAAYEDTRLTPEEVTALQKDWSILCTVIGECGGIERVKELAEADKAGRVVVPPCKVGDTLFRVFAGEILEHKVGNMRYLAIQGRWDIDTTPFCSYVESSIGKTIFLTREEAEKALGARKDGDETDL